MALKSLGTDSDQIQTGTTAERPTLAAGDAGSIRFNTTTGLMEQWDGSAWSSLSTGGGSSVSPASLSEAAAGTLTTVYSSPQTAVPKDASGMDGAALMPGGNDSERPGSPSTGMLRYNDQASPAGMEFYDGSSWSRVTDSNSSAGWTLIQEVNATNASTVDITDIDGSYSSYVIKVTDATWSTDSGTGLNLVARFMTGSTPSVPSSAGFRAWSAQHQKNTTMGDNLSSTTITYAKTWNMWGLQNPGDSFMVNVDGGNYLRISNEVNEDNNKNNFEIVLMDPGDSWGSHQFWWHGMQQEESYQTLRTETRHIQGEGFHFDDTTDPSSTTGSPITGVKFAITRNSLVFGTVTGKFQLYGL